MPPPPAAPAADVAAPLDGPEPPELPQPPDVSRPPGTDVIPVGPAEGPGVIDERGDRPPCGAPSFCALPPEPMEVTVHTTSTTKSAHKHSTTARRRQ